MEKEKILFIINPISGTKNKVRIPDLIRQNLDLSKFSYEVAQTKAPEHAAHLAEEGIKEGYKKFIAVGGDGTINEIARTIVNTPAELGIIPSGSGNGLSRHLGIPLNPIEAIKTVNSNKVINIDSGTLNDKPFFCTSGVGFDAHVGKLFAESQTRGINTYIKTTIAEFRKYNPTKYTVTIKGEIFSREAFLITFANSAQYGNNAYISPGADIQDGLIDVCIIKPFPKFRVVSMGMSLFQGNINKSKYIEIIKASEVKVERATDGPVHLDGEPAHMGRELKIKMHPGSLKIMVP